LPILGGSGEISIRMSLIFMGEHTTIDPDTNEEVKEATGLAIACITTLDNSDGMFVMLTPDNINYELEYDEVTGLLA
jgi:hypothetical protein